MEWALAAIAIVVIGLAVVVAAGRWGGLPPTTDDQPVPDLPAEGDLSGDDIRRARFAVVTRGYSMGQVDTLLSRLARQLDATTARAGALVPPPSQSAVQSLHTDPPTEVLDDDSTGWRRPPEPTQPANVG